MATAAKVPVAGNLGFAETIFELTQSSPYDFGVTTQLAPTLTPSVVDPGPV